MRDSAYDPVKVPAGFWHRPDVTKALERHDTGELYRLVQQWTGASQMRLGAATGFSQAKVSAMINGNYQPKGFALRTRIADGFGMPGHARVAFGLAPADRGSGAPAGLFTAEAEDTTADAAQYPATTGQAVTTVTGLWHADAAQLLLSAPVDPGAWNAAALAWLVAEPDAGLPGHRQGLAVGHSDVERVRAASKLFGQLDNRFGGALARRSMIDYLRHDATRLLAGRYADNVGRDLFSAIAEATLLAGFLFAEPVFA